MAMNEEQVNKVILNQLSDMTANFIKHPNNDEIKENYELPSKEGVELSIKLSKITAGNMGQLSQL